MEIIYNESVITLTQHHFKMKKVQQKELMHLITKSTDTTLTELANILGVELSSFRVTLSRNRLMFSQFCRIYKYVYGSSYNEGNELTDIMRNVRDLTLRSVVEIMEVNNTPIVVVLYKKTKVRLINPIK